MMEKPTVLTRNDCGILRETNLTHFDVGMIEVENLPFDKHEMDVVVFTNGGDSKAMVMMKW